LEIRGPGDIGVLNKGLLNLNWQHSTGQGHIEAAREAAAALLATDPELGNDAHLPVKNIAAAKAKTAWSKIRK
jgi:hypothetical protein